MYSKTHNWVKPDIQFRERGENRPTQPTLLVLELARIPGAAICLELHHSANKTGGCPVVWPVTSRVALVQAFPVSAWYWSTVG